jgi:hypothetical protein
MTQQALVYRSEADGKTPAYVGKTEFEAPLVVKKTNSYLQKRRWHFVRVDRIEPPTWNPRSEIVPTVYVSPAGSKPARPTARAVSRAIPRRDHAGS